MKYLFDTHALIWFLDGDPRFSRNALAALSESQNEIFVSVASIWEMAIKVSLGKLRVRLSLVSEFEVFLGNNGFHLLDIEYRHAAYVASLPFKHRDPFDRLLVAQASLENLVIVSHDPALDTYEIRRLW